MPDAEADSAVLVAAMGGDRAQSVMTGIAAADLHAEFRRWKIEFVVEDRDVAERDLEEPHGIRHRPSGFVHVGLRLEEDDLLARDRCLGRIGLEALSPGRRPVDARDFVHRHETDIVTVPGIAGAGIAESDEKAHRGAHS